MAERWRPNTRCFVSVKALPAPYVVDGIRRQGPKILTIEASNKFVMAEYGRPTISVPAGLLQPFRSGRWCVGNEDVNAMLANYHYVRTEWVKGYEARDSKHEKG